jgi:hypothetical protein
MYARHTLGALHVMRSMMDGMPKTIDVVAKATGNPNPIEWTGEVMGKVWSALFNR